eukprot:TRINITY_DN72399_c0_g1_i1.p1 TRINITY_DN72399_c0_g1~~TRINITY_DN72399_c0_g1_i1.p1  ORF type:complete len:368 (+),score=89.58 TRINITY_DN72399_c0_g1_i1:75-1106(+)
MAPALSRGQSPRKCAALKRLLLIATREVDYEAPGRDGCGALLAACFEEDAAYAREHGLAHIVSKVVDLVSAGRPCKDITGFLADAVADVGMRQTDAYAGLRRLHSQVSCRGWLTGAAAEEAPDEIVAAAQQFAAELEETAVNDPPLVRQRVLCDPLYKAVASHLRATESAYRLLRDVRARHAAWAEAPWRSIDYADMQQQIKALRVRRSALRQLERSDPMVEVDDSLACLQEAAVIADFLSRCDDFWGALSKAGAKGFGDEAQRNQLPLSALLALLASDGREEPLSGIRTAIAAAELRARLDEEARLEAEEEKRKLEEEEAAARGGALGATRRTPGTSGRKGR